jgi:hypothetical protein
MMPAETLKPMRKVMALWNRVLGEALHIEAPGVPSSDARVVALRAG